MISRVWSPCQPQQFWDNQKVGSESEWIFEHFLINLNSYAWNPNIGKTQWETHSYIPVSRWELCCNGKEKENKEKNKIKKKKKRRELNLLLVLWYVEQPKRVFEEPFKQKQNLLLVPVNSVEINVREEKKEHSTRAVYE